MTMDKDGKAVSESVHPGIEPDCCVSSTQPDQRQGDSVGTGGVRKLSLNARNRIIRKETRVNSASKTYRYTQEDIERDTDNICDQLDSFDIIDHDRRRPISVHLPQNGVTSENCAQQRGPDFRLVYVQNREGDTFLHLAIIHLMTALAVKFINVSPSHTWLNLRNHFYQTALHLAVITKQRTVIRRLIVGGADIESRDRFGNTPLHIACKDGYIEGVRTLLEPVRYSETKQNTCDIPYQRIPQNLEITNYDGVTALHLAATNGHLDIVSLLIEKRADVNSRDVKSGQSILHKACWDGNLPLVQLLLKCKECYINSRTYDDYTPFDFARARSCERIKYELAVAGANYANELEEYD